MHHGSFFQNTSFEYPFGSRTFWNCESENEDCSSCLKKCCPMLSLLWKHFLPPGMQFTTCRRRNVLERMLETTRNCLETARNRLEIDQKRIKKQTHKRISRTDAAKSEIHQFEKRCRLGRNRKCRTCRLYDGRVTHGWNSTDETKIIVFLQSCVV